MRIVRYEIDKAHAEGRELRAGALEDFISKAGWDLKEELQRISNQSGIDIFSGRQ